MKIGFLGLGIMGSGMARNLSHKGHAVKGWNRSALNKRKGLEKVEMADSIRKAIADCDVVMLSVTGPDAQKDVLLGVHGVFAHADAGTLILDMTTTDPDLSKEFAKLAANHQMHYIDSPVFGSKEESWNGKLDIVWGGDTSARKKAGPIWKAISKSVHHMGGQGAGAAMKLIGNNVVALEFLALAEGLALARKSGVNLKSFSSVLKEVDYGSGLLINNARNAIANDYEPFFYLKHMLKDTRLVQDFARAMNVAAFGASVASQSFQGAMNDGFGDENASAIVKYIGHISGIAK